MRWRHRFLLVAEAIYKTPQLLDFEGQSWRVDMYSSQRMEGPGRPSRLVAAALYRSRFRQMLEPIVSSLLRSHMTVPAVCQAAHALPSATVFCSRRAEHRAGLKAAPGVQGGWLLQTAAASSVGRQVIQIAKSQGVKTINVVRSGNATQHQELRDLGCPPHSPTFQRMCISFPETQIAQSMVQLCNWIGLELETERNQDIMELVM